MIATYPYKIGDKVRTHVPGNPKGIATVLDVDEKYNEYGELTSQDIKLTAPQHGGAVWMTMVRETLR